MTEKATTGHSLGDRYRKGREHHDPGCDPGALAGGISLKLRGQPVWYHLSSLFSGLIVLPPASPTCSLCRNHKVVPWDKEETGEIQILLFGGGGSISFDPTNSHQEKANPDSITGWISTLLEKSGSYESWELFTWLTQARPNLPPPEAALAFPPFSRPSWLTQHGQLGD